MNSPFVNIHSHKPISSLTVGIESFCVHDLSFDHQWPQSYSVGIHPWYIHKTDVKQAIKQLGYMADDANFKAFGECGLDRAIARDFDIQYSVFIQQIKLAEEFNKPVIIHNVRAFADILGLLKKEKPAVPFIFHAFNGNLDILNKLLKHNVYFSIGHDIFKNNSKTQRILEHIPLNRLFFETDEWEGDISEIYSQASKMLNVEMGVLKTNAYYNYKSIF